ncbi:MAG: hypothetical protein PVF68_12795 [Acidobacteriota bacterium]|jgi:hypothetical protein
MRTIRTLWAVVAILGASGVTPAGDTPCERAAMAARMACRNDVRDDYYTSLGRCENLAEAPDREECRGEAEEARREDGALCREQHEARLDLCDQLDEYRYAPEIDPADFLSPEQAAADPNPYFPLVPGRTWIYENEEERITVTVTDETREILGIECIAVRDTVQSKLEAGDLIEDTTDWYAQDVEGNLWYFGEVARNYEDGFLVDLEGSWVAGEEGAQPGVLLWTVPFPGLVYREEYLLREAEDAAEVLAVDASTPELAADCEDDCLATRNFTPIEPDVIEWKFYVPGIGLVLELDPESGERTELVSHNFK